MQKGFLSTLLALCIALALLPVTALAETVASGEWGADGDNVTWTHDSNGTLTIRGTGRMADSLAPWWNQYYPIDTVVIEDGVTSIGEEAFFYNSWGIKNISIPDSVTRIGANAFHGCGEMKSITLPKNLKNIDGSLFTSCESLQEIKVDSENPDYKSVDGVLFSKDGTTLIKYPCGKAGTYTIPDGVTRIGDCAFDECRSLTGITIPEGVTRIGDCGFICCSGLTEITIPDGVANIGESAFSGCTGLTEITIPDSVTRIGRYAFSGCWELTGITIPARTTSIGRSAFSMSGIKKIIVDSRNPDYKSIDGVLFNKDGTSLITCPNGRAGSYNIPNGVTRIEDDAFAGCGGLTGITIPDSVSSIGDGAFSDCRGLTGIAIPEHVTWIEDYVFDNCTGLTEITIPDSATSLGFAAFAYSGLETIVIPDSLTCIEGCMFSNSGLSSITIPDSVTSIEYQAFSDCPKLLTIAIHASVNSIGRDAFGGRCNMTDLYYGGSEQQWLAAGGPVEIYGDSTTIHFDILQKTTDSLSPVREHFSITEVLCACFEQIRTIFGFTHKNGTDG